MMLEELTQLLDSVNADSSKEQYKEAVTGNNCLGKRSAKTRSLSFRHLADLYALDPDTILFRALRYFWDRDIAGRPMLALVATYARDSLFRSTASYILETTEGTAIPRESVEELVENQYPGRFSNATLKSAVRNISSTWTQSGHLEGRRGKVRRKATPTAGSCAYGLFLGHLTGTRGQLLLETGYMKLLDCTSDRKLDLATEASRKGWIEFKHIGDVVDVAFPNLITRQEMEELDEQG